MSEFKISCSTVVEQDSGFLLVADQVAGSKGSVLSLPGGTREPGETLIECATRETEEESGFSVEVTGFAGLYYFAKTKGRKNQVIRPVYSADVLDGELLKNDADFYTYKQIKKLDEKGLLKSNGTMQAIRNYRKHGVQDLSAAATLTPKILQPKNLSKLRKDYSLAA